MPAIYRNGTRYGNAPTSYPAENVAYDPTTSNLPATNAQNAIDELADATPRIASAGPAAEVIFNTDTVAPFQEIKCSVNAIQEGTPWIDSNVIEKEPYNFRKVAGTASRIGNHLYDKLVGGTVAWNQIKENGNFVDISTYNAPNGTMTVSNNELVFSSGNSNRNYLNAVLTNEYTTKHKYLVMFTYKSNKAFSVQSVVKSTVFNLSASSDYNTYAYIIFNDDYSSAYNTMYFYNYSSLTENEWTLNLKNFVIFDLTQMFGSTIADYVYSLEQATAGAGVAWFKALFPNDYYAYNAGELISVKTTAHKMVGKNLFDVTLTSQTVNDVVFTVNSDKTITANGTADGNIFLQIGTIHVVAGQTYTLTGCPSGGGSGVYSLYASLTDGNKNDYGSGNTFTATVTEDAPVRIAVYNTKTINGAYKPQIELGSQATTYEPYIEHNYALDDVELRGLFKLDSNNKLYYDGDTYSSDGSVKRRFGIVVFDGSSDEDWKTGGNNQFYIAENSLKKLTDYRNSMICSKMDVMQRNGSLVSKGISGYYDQNSQYQGQNWIYVYISDTISNLTDLRAWLSINPITVVYELATPTTEQASPFTNPQVCDANGTEEYIDSRTPAIPVGHETYYADIYDISGFTQLKLNHTGQEVTVAFGQTVYGGVLDVLSGKLTVTKGYIDLSTLDPATLGSSPVFYAQLTNVKVPASNSDIAEVISEAYTPIRYNGVAGTVNTVAINTSGYIYVNTGSALIIPTGIAIFTLATPVEIQLTAHQLETILGQNTLSHDCNGDTEVKYYTSGVSVIKDLIDATPIDDLSNVSISSPTNNQILTYNSTSSKWENKAPVVDSSLSSTSTNPVQNKVIDTALAGKADKSTTYTKTEVDNKFDDIEPIGTATGNPCNFVTDSALPLASLKANIVASGGNGTPSTPIPIVGHSELNLVRCGKNLAYRTIQAYPGGIAPHRVTIDNDSESAIFFAIKGETYTISSSVTMNRSAIVRISSPNPENLTPCLEVGTVTTNTWVAEWTGWTMWYKVSTANLDFEASAQVELGSTATAYAPYNGTPYLVSFGQTVYGCTYTADGKLRLIKGFEPISKDWNWVKSSSYDGAFYVYVDDIPTYNIKKNVPFICSHLQSVTSISNYVYGTCLNDSALNFFIMPTGSTMQDFKDFIDAQALANTPIQICYELATPIEIDVSELSVDTIVGVNNIISDGGGDVEVQYLKNADMAEFVETIHNSLSPIILTGTLNAGETSITFSSDAITEDSLIEIYTDPNIFYTGTTTSDGEIEITFPERQYNVSVKVRII